MNVNQKIIENYKFLQVRRILPNGVHIIHAEHIKTGVKYTIKKACLPAEDSALDCSSKDGYESVKNEIQLLKNLNLARVIKCHKFLKTKKNLYAVYDQYPELQLTEYLQRENPNVAQKMNIAFIICQMLINLHKKGYIYVNLHPGCILVDPNQNIVKFVGFQYCVKTEEKNVMKLASQNSFMAPELRSQKAVSIAVDSYSFGKILELLKISHRLDPQTGIQFHTPIQNILGSLTSELPLIRASLETVMLCLQLKENYNSTKSSVNQNESSQKSRRYVSLRNAKSDRVRRRKANKSIGKKLEPLKASQCLANKKKILKIIKIRNLSLFLFGLAKFCIKEFQLMISYLLMKKATIICGNLLHQSQKAQLQRQRLDYSQIIRCITAEYTQFKAFQIKLKELLEAKKVDDQNGQDQLKKDHIISEQYLQKTIKRFIQNKREKYNYQETNYQSAQRKGLQQLCFLSQKLGYGSFQQFFEEGINEQIIHLQQQRYFRYIKSATTKELLEKIDATISK